MAWKCKCGNQSEPNSSGIIGFTLLDLCGKCHQLPLPSPHQVFKDCGNDSKKFVEQSKAYGFLKEKAKLPITQIKGAENLPQKKDNAKEFRVLLPTERDYFNGGFAEAVDQLNQCAIVLDEEELAVSLFEWATNTKWKDLGDSRSAQRTKEYYYMKSKALCANPGKILRIERIEK